jgi:hypothetical protein
MKRAAQLAGFLAFVGIGVAAIYNVVSDNHDVETMAKAVACGSEGAACRPQTTRIERSPIAQSFSIVTAKRSVDVRCVRSLILVGDYACALR